MQGNARTGVYSTFTPVRPKGLINNYMYKYFKEKILKPTNEMCKQAGLDEIQEDTTSMEEKLEAIEELEEYDHNEDPYVQQWNETANSLNS